LKPKAKSSAQFETFSFVPAGVPFSLNHFATPVRIASSLEVLGVDGVGDQFRLRSSKLS
jgi:hypothetical protein